MQHPSRLGQGDGHGCGGVVGVESSDLPAVAGDAWVAPHVQVAPVLTTLAVVALVEDGSPFVCLYTFQVI